MEYTYQVRSWDEKGVPFRTHLYVPENHPITGNEFHEREDEAHVFKVNILINLAWQMYLVTIECVSTYSVLDTAQEQEDHMSSNCKGFMKLWVIQIQN